MLAVRKIGLRSFREKKFNYLAPSCFNTAFKSPTLKTDLYIAVSLQCGAMMEKSFAEGMNVTNV